MPLFIISFSIHGIEPQQQQQQQQQLNIP